MKIHAYAEAYLPNARRCMGEMLSYAVDTCGMSMDVYFELFIGSGMADLFEAGTPAILCGLSGIELVHLTLRKAGMDLPLPKENRIDPDTCAYWIGFILADYQWASGNTFSDILTFIPLKSIEDFWLKNGTVEPRIFRDAADNLKSRSSQPTRLQIIRRSCGYSQKLLSERSGVHLRSIQQYEQRAKDIGKASAGSLVALSRTLGCGVEDLLESSISITVLNPDLPSTEL